MKFWELLASLLFDVLERSQKIRSDQQSDRDEMVGVVSVAKGVFRAGRIATGSSDRTGG